MRKKLLKLMSILLIVSSICFAVSCGKADNSNGKNSGSYVAPVVTENGFTFTVDEHGPVSSKKIELGNLFIPDKIYGSIDGKKVKAVVSVKTSDGNDVALVNNKFKANDINGYQVFFTAVIGDKSDTFTQTVKVVDTTKPTFSINGTNGTVVMKNDTITVPECVVIDASSSSIVPTITVKSPSGQSVSVDDGSFVSSEMGPYIITYTATDASGNVGKQEFVFNCENATMLNAFETVDSVYRYAFECDVETTTENAQKGNAVKFTITGLGEHSGNYRRIWIPLKKPDGAYYTYAELQNFTTIQMYIYASSMNEFGLAMNTKEIQQGKNTVSWSIDEIMASYNASNGEQYSPNDEGFYLNLKYPTVGTYYIFDSMIGILDPEYVYPIVFTDTEGNNIDSKTLYQGNVNEEFTVPEIEPRRQGVLVDYTVSVKDADGNDVELQSGNKFTLTCLDGYTVTYTASDSNGSSSVSVSIYVKDTSIPEIIVNEHSGAFVPFGSMYTCPSSTVNISTGENIRASVSVKDPDGNDVALTDEMFSPMKEGAYVLTYSAISAENGKSSTKSIVVNCFKGNVLNPCEVENDLDWMQIEHVKESVFENARTGNGMKITFTGTPPTSWPRINLPLYGNYQNRTYLTLTDLLSYSSIEIYVYASTQMTFGLGNDLKDLFEGVNVITITKSEIQAFLNADASAYSESKDGLYLAMGSPLIGSYIIIDDVIGYNDAIEVDIVNPFNTVFDLDWIQVENAKEAVSGGVKVTFTDDNPTDWPRFNLPLYDDYQNRTYLTQNDLLSYSRIEIYVYASAEMKFGLGNGLQTLNAGDNVLTITREEIQEFIDLTPEAYSDNSNGLYMALHSPVKGTYMIFRECHAYK